MGAIPYGCNSTSTIDSCSLFCTAPSITTSLSTLTIVIVGRALTIRKGKKRKKENPSSSGDEEICQKKANFNIVISSDDED